jgi:hypothetical protein
MYGMDTVLPEDNSETLKVDTVHISADKLNVLFQSFQAPAPTILGRSWEEGDTLSP